MNNLDFWRRWVVANALGELVGLGATFSIGFLAFSVTGEPRSVGAVLLLAGATVLTGVRVDVKLSEADFYSVIFSAIVLPCTKSKR